MRIRQHRCPTDGGPNGGGGGGGGGFAFERSPVVKALEKNSAPARNVSPRSHGFIIHACRSLPSVCDAAPGEKLALYNFSLGRKQREGKSEKPFPSRVTLIPGTDRNSSAIAREQRKRKLNLNKKAREAAVQ